MITSIKFRILINPLFNGVFENYLCEMSGGCRWENENQKVFSEVFKGFLFGKKKISFGSKVSSFHIWSNLG